MSAILGGEEAILTEIFIGLAIAFVTTSAAFVWQNHRRSHSNAQRHDARDSFLWGSHNDDGGFVEEQREANDEIREDMAETKDQIRRTDGKINELLISSEYTDIEGLSDIHAQNWNDDYHIEDGGEDDD